MLHQAWNVGLISPGSLCPGWTPTRYDDDDDDDSSPLLSHFASPPSYTSPVQWLMENVWRLLDWMEVWREKRFLHPLWKFPVLCTAVKDELMKVQICSHSFGSRSSNIAYFQGHERSEGLRGLMGSYVNKGLGNDYGLHLKRFVCSITWGLYFHINIGCVSALSAARGHWDGPKLVWWEVTERQELRHTAS